MNIPEIEYDQFLKDLLNGDKPKCVEYVRGLLDNGIQLKTLYLDLFQPSLYDTGTLWEHHEISVATEHMVTAIVESLMVLGYATLFEGPLKRDKVIVSCTANEIHQVGGKMVADICEFKGWSAFFTGADTPLNDLLRLIEEQRPMCIALSLSIYFNLNPLLDAVDKLKERFPSIPLLVGGQAFLHGGTDKINSIPGVEYVPTLDALELKLAEYSK